MQQEIEKKFFVSDRIASEFVSLSCHFSSAANVLASSPKIWHVNKRDFFEHNLLSSDKWIW